jgi:acetyltransferase-like isoleucine patch superfamily enzyme
MINKIILKLRSLFSARKFAFFGKYSLIGKMCKFNDSHLISIGSGVTISDFAWLNASDALKKERVTLSIGDKSYLGSHIQINAFGNVKIGKNVLIADRVFITDADHNYLDKSKPISDQGDRFVSKVEIKDGCWLGIGCVIMPGVTIGKNAIVTPNSVVFKDVDDYSIVGGNPAKVIQKY